MTIEEKYIELCNTPSDINQHLPILREYADRCEHVTEFGVRGCVSLHAFLSSKAKKVVAYDIMNVEVPECDKLTFINADVLEVTIERTDFLFIDTIHSYKQLKKELELHAKNVNKYIGFHDTEMFGESGEDGSEPGLMRAIQEFITQDNNWQVCYHTINNNGLTIIHR